MMKGVVEIVATAVVVVIVVVMVVVAVVVAAVAYCVLSPSDGYTSILATCVIHYASPQHHCPHHSQH